MWFFFKLVKISPFLIIFKIFFIGAFLDRVSLLKIAKINLIFYSLYLVLILKYCFFLIKLNVYCDCENLGFIST